MTLLRRARGLVDGGPPLVLVGLFGVLGFLLVTASSSATAVKRAEQPRRTQLAALIQQRPSVSKRKPSKPPLVAAAQTLLLESLPLSKSTSKTRQWRSGWPVSVT